MNGPDVRRLTPGTVTIQMLLNGPVWSYGNDLPVRFVDVEVEVRALLRLGLAGAGNREVRPTLFGNRKIIELAALRIIDREGPYFVEPVRVRVTDVLAQLAQMRPGTLQANEREAAM